MVTVADFTPLESPGPRVKASSLMESTPPSIVRALSLGYPLFVASDRILAILTWTTSDKFESFLMLSVYIMAVRNFERIMKYWLPTALAVGVALLLNCTQHLKNEQPPTLEEAVYVLECASRRYRKFVSPLTSLQISGKELVRLALSSLLLSPVYLLISMYALSFKTLMIITGSSILSWHSLWFRVFRSVAWRSPAVRWLVFVITGVDRIHRERKSSDNAHADASSLSTKTPNTPSQTPKRDVTFTFVVMENQRHWIGIGWTTNLLPEERAAWTDPSLNEVSPIESFELPIAEGGGMVWKWVDSEWQADLTHDGFILVPDSTSKLEASPGRDEGFVYFNNLWSSPSARSGFSKYTRTRRWVRKASLSTMTEMASEKLQGLVDVKEVEAKPWSDEKSRGVLRNRKSK